jgi:hypothetical protein
MAGLQDISQKYSKILNEMPKQRERLALIFAKDAFALVANRIQNSGIDKDGEKMPLYSRAPLPYWKLNENEFNAPTKIKKFKSDSAAGKIQPSYESLRKAYGLPTDKRTLTFDGAMFKSIIQEVTRHEDYITEVTIKSENRKDQNKVNSNSKIIGKNILSFGDIEGKFLRELNEKRIKDMFKLQN